MSVKTRKFTQNRDNSNPQEVSDTSFDQRETTVDGYTFHWGANQTRNFVDDNIGARHAAFGAIDVAVDTTVTGDSRS